MEKKIDRKFRWVSSSDPENLHLLNNLHTDMINFYSKSHTRNDYQEMLDSNDNELEDPGIVTMSFIDYLKKISGRKIMEIGCGSGRIYKHIEKCFPEMEYTGIEVSESIIGENRLKYPSATWEVANAYNVPVADESVDICFSFYVLEHLVFPEKGIKSMLRTVKKGGYLILIFPDFIQSGRFASQKLGLSSLPTFKEKLKRGKLIDAIIGLYDSRIRLPNALTNSIEKVGEFPVNTSPKCLDQDDDIFMLPDIDAVYIASKDEVTKWAFKQGLEPIYPVGKHGYFSEHAFLSIKK